jgi:hypothetical protein
MKSWIFCLLFSPIIGLLIGLIGPHIQSARETLSVGDVFFHLSLDAGIIKREETHKHLKTASGSAPADHGEIIYIDNNKYDDTCNPTLKLPVLSVTSYRCQKLNFWVFCSTHN